MTISDEHLHTVCLMGQGPATCRYITAGYKGIECAKLTPLARMIDRRVLEGNFTAQGDNCPGLSEESDDLRDPV